MKMNLCKLSNCFIICGIIALSFGIISYLVAPRIIKQKITEETRLINNSETFWKWKKPDLPIFIQFYFYNVTNPDEVQKGASPIFTEIGPIVYQERRVKEVDDIDIDEDTLTFRQSIKYGYRNDLSAVSEDHILTTLNIPFVTISKMGLSMDLAGGILRESVHDYMKLHPNQVNVFVTRKIRELLFEGYYDGLLEELSKLHGQPLFPNHKFGLYVGKNATFGLPLTIDAGVKNFEHFGNIIEFNGNRKINNWGENIHCNRINGSDGSLFPPFVTKERIVRLFSEDACRSIYLKFQKEIDFHGLIAYRFHLPKEIWESAQLNEENQCFCESSLKCDISGLMDVGPCRKGAPVFASMPHFLYGDPKLWNSSIGIKEPIQDRDETYLDIEPMTGLLLSAMKRFQINVDLFPNRRVRGFRYVPKMIFPILWGEEYFISNEERAEMLKNKLFKPIKSIGLIIWICFIIGIILVCIGSCFLLFRIKTFNTNPLEKSMNILKWKQAINEH